MEAARRLACDGGNLASGFTSAAGLAACCDHSTLATLLGLLATASGPDGTSRLLAVTPAAAGAALEASANCGSFEWAFEGYSQLPAGVGERTLSPYFEAAGCMWRFQACPGGDNAESAGHLSGKLWVQPGSTTERRHAASSTVRHYVGQALLSACLTGASPLPATLACHPCPAAVFITSKDGGVTANMSVTIVDQGPLKQDKRLQSMQPRTYVAAGTTWGWTKFIPVGKLRHPSKAYLRGDRLLLRATVEVTQRHVQPAAA